MWVCLPFGSSWELVEANHLPNSRTIYELKPVLISWFFFCHLINNTLSKSDDNNNQPFLPLLKPSQMLD